MRDMRKLLFCIPLLFVLLSCDIGEDGGRITVASWNLYLMFDGKDDGTEYHPFAGDNSKAYARRLELTYPVLSAMEPDILVLEEIENTGVIEDLIDMGLGKLGYRWYALADGVPFGVAFISKLRPERVRVHRTGNSRPFLDAVFSTPAGPVRIFMLHAKSRLGGGERERAETYGHIRELAEEADMPVIIAGDFNEDPREGPSMLDVSRGPSVLPVTGDPSRTRPGVFYTEILNDIDAATFAWEGRWYGYDQMLMNDLLFDGAGLEWVDTRAVILPGMLGDDGFPERFTHEAWKGFSDHLPIVTELRYH